MSARRVAAVVALLGGAVVCPGAAQERPFVGGERSADEILGDLSSRAPRRVRQVGTSSVTLRVDLGAGVEMAFKPRTRSHSRGYVAEIAAYRLSRALGMDNVPPVIGRQLPRRVLEERFESDHREDDWEAIRGEVLWDAPGVVRGAAIYWVPRMRSSELSTLRGLEQAAPWLAQSGEAPPEQAGVARDLSNMLAFDYLIGNWDRFSGGNVSTNEAGDRLFVRDHNVAFLEPLRGERYERLRRGLERVERFSRSFVERLRALDREAIEEALRADPEGRERPLLDERQIEGVLARRRALLSYVGALVEVHGEGRVFAWR